MSRDWGKYNEELIKRGEIFIEAQTEQTRKTGRPPLYSDKTNSGTCQKALLVPNFRTIHYGYKTIRQGVKRGYR